MSLQHLIGPHANFELELLSSQEDETLWLNYADAVAGDLARSVFVLERAVCALPASPLLWNAYLSLPWKPDQHHELISLYKRALSILSSTPAYWFRLIELLSLEPLHVDSMASLMQALDSALICLHPSHHSKIWTKYIELVEHDHTEACRDRCISIYRRVFEALPSNPVEETTKTSTNTTKTFTNTTKTSTNTSTKTHPIPQSFMSQQICVLKIAELGDYSTAHALLTSLPNQEVDFLRQYMKILSKDPDFSDDSYFEQLAQKIMLDHPKSRSHVLFWLADYHSDRHRPEKARHLFSVALESASSIHDAAAAFDRYTNWEENQMERCMQDAIDGLEVKFLMDHFEAVLGSHSLYLNDVLIKENPNCVDYWLDRFAMLVERPNDRIAAYVQAIRTINPLEAISFRKNSLATIWTDYADIYLDSGDVKSAEVIYSRAVKTPFKSVQELTDLYIRWTELKLGISDEAALCHIEEVLFIDSEENLVSGMCGPQVSGNKGDKKGDKETNKEAKETNKETNKTDAANLVALSHSSDLWKFYLDLLHAIPDSGLDRLDTAYKRMLSLQLLSLRMLFDYTTFLIKQSKLSQCYNMYETALVHFHSREAQAIIWAHYLHDYMQHEPTEAVHQLFSRCLRTSIPGHCAYSIFSSYGQFCASHGKLVPASKVFQSGIEYLSMAKDARPEQRKLISAHKYQLYTELLSVLKKINDDALLRQTYSNALEDEQLFVADTVDLGMQFVGFEKKKCEFVRVRHLFRHMTTLGHPSMALFKDVWDSWESFEVENGNEASFKELLREKRQITKRFGDLAELKAEINPIGFIKGETSKDESEVADENPNAIVDMEVNPNAIVDMEVNPNAIVDMEVNPDAIAVDMEEM